MSNTHLLLIFIYMSLMSCAVKENGTGEQEVAQGNYFTEVDTVGNMLVYHPHYRHIDLVCGTMPKENDESVIFCAEAAFTWELLEEFKHSNIMGPHISGGVRYKGYNYDKNYGLFAATDSSWCIAELPNDRLLDDIVRQGGMAFTQFWVIRDGAIRKTQIQKPTRQNIYRAIADLKGELVIVESKQVMPYQEFVEGLKALQVTNALFMDMGAGWNYSFYRDKNNSLHVIHPHTHNYCTNWITFYK